CRRNRRSRGRRIFSASRWRRPWRVCFTFQEAHREGRLKSRSKLARRGGIVNLNRMENILPIVIADAPWALKELCGVNLLERLLRILQRLGFRRAIVFSSTPEIVGAELAHRSWAREEITVHLVPGANRPLTAQLLLEQSPSERFLII